VFSLRLNRERERDNALLLQSQNSIPVNLEILILIIIAIAATIFSVVVSIGVVVRKVLDEKQAKQRKHLHQVYSAQFAELLLQDLPPVKIEPRKNSTFKQYDLLLKPINAKLSQMLPSALRFHRTAIRKVLIDFSKDLTGESFDRLTYFFYGLSLVDDELQRLKSRSWWIRAESANTLGRLRARKAIGPLTAALEDPITDVRLEAMQALVVLVGVEALRTIFRMSHDLSRWTTIEMSMIVGRYKNAAVPYLIEALRGKDRSVVIFCIEMLAEIGFVSAVEPLLLLADLNQDPEIQAKVLDALGRLGDVRSKGPVMAFLHHADQTVRLKAIEALGRIGGEGVVETLRPRLARPSFEEKLVVARALAATGSDGIAALKELVEKSDDRTAAIARQVMEECGEFEEVL
jgi:hypothetical protein